jgi:hypothetical protein
MSETLDFTKYSQGNNFEVLPAATYKVEIGKWEKCVARTGMEQIRVYATVVGGEHDGKPLADHMALSEKATWRVMWFINEALGWEKEDREQVGKIAIGSEKFNRCFDLAKGRTMFWTIIIDPSYNNNKVIEYIPCEEEEKVLPDDLEDVPDFIKNK